MITRETVEHIAGLSQLELSQDELNRYSTQLVAILNYFEELSKVDTSNIAPLVTPSDIHPHLREDMVQASLSADEVMANAPATKGHLFKVPPVVG